MEKDLIHVRYDFLVVLSSPVSLGIFSFFFTFVIFSLCLDVRMYVRSVCSLFFRETFGCITSRSRSFVLFEYHCGSFQLQDRNVFRR